MNRALTHSGDPRLARHVGNTVLKLDARGTRLAKEHRDSARKIDLAVAAVKGVDRAGWHAGRAAPMIYVYRMGGLAVPAAREGVGGPPGSRGVRGPDPGGTRLPVVNVLPQYDDFSSTQVFGVRGDQLLGGGEHDLRRTAAACAGGAQGQAQRRVQHALRDDAQAPRLGPARLTPVAEQAVIGSRRVVGHGTTWYARSS